MTKAYTFTTRLFTAVFFLLLALSAAHAQNVSFKGDVITVDKKPYAKLTKGGSMMMREFTLLSLDDKEVMKTKGTITSLPSGETFIYYVLTFLPGNETAEMSKTGLNFAQQLAEALVKNEVMRDGQPNPEGIARFTAAYGEKLSAKYAAETDAQKNAKPLVYDVVDRPRTGGLSVNPTDRRGEKPYRIMQGNTLIGLMTKKPGTSIQNLYDITLPTGFTIASVDMFGNGISAMDGDTGQKQVSIKLLVKKDNKYHNMTAVGGLAQAQQDIVKYLVTGGYL